MRPFRRYSWFSVMFCFVSVLELSVPDASNAATALEDVEWHLVELDGKKITMEPGERRPFIRFDSSTSQARGYAGCNNFFGEYLLNGSSLSFGPIGSTRRACGKTQDTLEIEFLKALGATKALRIRDNGLLLFDGDKVLARFELAGS